MYKKFSIFLIFIAFFQVAYASEQAAFSPDKALRYVKNIDEKLSQNSSRLSLDEALETTLDYQKKALECIKAQEAIVKRLKQPLDVVGKATEGESHEIIQQRRILERQFSEADNRLSECRLLKIHAEKLTKDLTEYLKQRLTNQLFASKLPIWELFQKDEAWAFRFEPTHFYALSGADLFTPLHKILLAGVIVFSLVAASWIRAKAKRAVYQLAEDTFVDKLFKYTADSFAYFTLPLFLAASLSLYAFLLTHTLEFTPFIALLCYGILLYLILLTINRVLLYVPDNAKRSLVSLPKSASKVMFLRLNMLTTFFAVSFIAYSFLLSQPLSIHVLYLAQDIFITILTVDLLWLVWLVGRLSLLKSSMRLFRFVSMMALTAVLMAEWSGYRNLAEFILFNYLKTVGFLVVFWLLTNLMREFFKGVAEGSRDWQQSLRASLGLQANEKALGLYWLYMFVSAIFWGVLLVVLLRVWGLPEAEFDKLYQYIVKGFQIGESHIVPAHFFVGLLAFAILLIFFGWIRDQLVKKSLIRTGVERGAREAVVSISGYISFIIAVLIGLTIAGVNFSNLALIAGALSVGIGFGLQNVVNNFISGIILLFERPVKTGDWVVVGTTEGYVKKISIRSTLIQTFDRSDVIVPNSELISNQVTNWMFKEHFGRVNIDIGVAYGSDTKLVRDILLEVAKAHAEVITNGLTPDPDVLFMSFGDSALNFRLRAHIFDIDKRWRVVSDLNFAIDEAFRKHKITIPFPQRDLHIKNWPNKDEPPTAPQAD